jgi:hypothetical protein
MQQPNRRGTYKKNMPCGHSAYEKADNLLPQVKDARLPIRIAPHLSCSVDAQSSHRLKMASAQMESLCHTTFQMYPAHYAR